MTDNMERYYLLKAHGICTVCGREDAMPGAIRCPKCAEKQHDRCRIYYQEHKAELAASHAVRYQERKSVGICVVCGKVPARSGRVKCRACAERDAKRHKEKSTAVPRILFGNGERCHLCGKPTENGKKLCGVCYEKACKNLAYGRTCKTRQGGFDAPFLFGKKYEGKGTNTE